LNLDTLTLIEEKELLDIFDYKCFKCGINQEDAVRKDIRGLVMDHHYPISIGFGLSKSNCVVLCLSCNSKKKNKMPEVFYSSEELMRLHYMGVYTSMTSALEI
jgi:5-methylcytosine-specific restriction endonuclease McrA